MRNADLNKVFLATLLAVIITGSSAMSAFNTVIIRSSGTIVTVLPLHVDGKHIKDSLNRTVYLKGVWIGEFADTSTGWWGPDAFRWNETALRYTLMTLRQQWRVNCIFIYFWGDWWLGNKRDTLNYPNSTDIGLRDAVVRTIQIAAEYGIYVQVRLFSPSRAEGRVEGLPFQPTYSWTAQDFIDFWVNVSLTLKDYPNVIYCLFDEPSGSEAEMITYFDVANQTITEMRAHGVNQLIMIHWGYCGDMLWVADWVEGGYPLENIVFSEHIYRYHGTFAWNPNSPITLDYIKNFLTSPYAEPDGTATRYIMDTYNVPILVSAIGAHNGVSDDEEYIAFRNTLQALNEIDIAGYAVFAAFRTTIQWSPVDWSGTFGAPNRIGQALIDAIAGIPPPPIYQLTIETNIGRVQFYMNSNKYYTPFSHTIFAGKYIVSMPSSVTVYTHNPLFGSTTIGPEGGYSNYIYTAGPYNISSPATVSKIYLYTLVSGHAKVAIYNTTVYNHPSFPPGWPLPAYLIVASGERLCQANSWNLFSIPETYLPAGSYYLAIKFDTNGMLSGVDKEFFGAFTSSSYNDQFPGWLDTEGRVDIEYAVYVAFGPIQEANCTFVHWEDDSTNPQRTIILINNMTLTATYEPT